MGERGQLREDGDEDGDAGDLSDRRAGESGPSTEPLVLDDDDSALLCSALPSSSTRDNGAISVGQLSRENSQWR